MAALRRTSFVSVALAVIAVGALLPGGSASADDRQMAAFFIDYVPNAVTINEGDSLLFANTDPFSGAGHTVSHNPPPGVAPLFDSAVIPFGSAVEIPGIPELKRGDYLIQCRVHPLMRAFLSVGGPPRPITDAVKDFLGL
jgi:plastocyanin